MKRAFWILVLLTTLSGCATGVVTSLREPYETVKGSVRVVDQRPINQKKQELMSLNIMSCQYGSYQMGEENERPERSKVLANILSHDLNDEFREKTILLKNFVVHVNAAAQLRTGVANMYGGGLLSDALIQEKVVGCSNDDLLGGYSTGELTDAFPPLIVVIDVEIDGKSYHSRTLASLKSHAWGERNPKWDDITQAAIFQASTNLADSINEHKFVVLK